MTTLRSCGRIRQCLAHAGPAVILASRKLGKLAMVFYPLSAHPVHFLSMSLNSVVPTVQCFEHSGQRCTCSGSWLCDVCSMGDHATYPSVISCSRCGASYCRKGNGCRYCHFCQICCRAGVCLGCQALEKGDVGGDYTLGEGEPLHEYEQCLRCRAHMCNECCLTAKGGVAQCLGCHHWMCGKCARGQERCHSCR